MFMRDILYLTEFVKENGEIYSFEEFKIKYELNINFLTYYSIIHAIPASFKKSLCHRQKITEGNLQKIMKLEKVSKSVYNTMINKSSIFPEKAFVFL